MRVFLSLEEDKFSRRFHLAQNSFRSLESPSVPIARTLLFSHDLEIDLGFCFTIISYEHILIAFQLNRFPSLSFAFLAEVVYVAIELPAHFCFTMFTLTFGEDLPLFE